MKKEFNYLSADGKTQIHAIEWIPEGSPIATLQIAHGMVEFIDRYDRFAAFLNSKGFYVAGNDHLGHGASVLSDDDHGYFGEPSGNEYVIGDMHTLRTMISEKYPDIPHFLMGHSMGSFLVRQYITRFGKGLAGAVISGTGYQKPGTLKAGKSMARFIARFRGWRHRSKFINNMALGSYNKKFEPGRTRNDWLTRDEAIVDAYNENPWNNFMFTVNGYHELFTGLQEAQDEKAIAVIPTDLPILLVSGGDDPVGEFGKGPQTVADIYKKAGIRDVSCMIYPEDRHEILNELDYEKVQDDIYAWMSSRM